MHIDKPKQANHLVRLDTHAHHVRLLRYDYDSVQKKQKAHSNLLSIPIGHSKSPAELWSCLANFSNDAQI
jgi:hypothetical protein